VDAPTTKNLLSDLRGLILRTRQDVARTVNSSLVLLYWKIGQRVRTEILEEKRAAYGKEIVSTLSSQLGWSHFVQIIALKDDLQREFYAAVSRIDGWSVRQLRAKISGMLFERTALSKKPTELIKQEIVAAREQDQITPDLVFRDP